MEWQNQPVAGLSFVPVTQLSLKFRELGNTIPPSSEQSEISAMDRSPGGCSSQPGLLFQDSRLAFPK